MEVEFNHINLRALSEVLAKDDVRIITVAAEDLKQVDKTGKRENVI